MFQLLFADIDECDADPCLNRGTCSDGVNSYSCKCPVKYIGNDCETDTCPNSESFNYVESLHYCFKVFTNTVNHWDNAINNCQQQGLELAILETDAKLSAVRQTIIGNAAYSNADTSYYIGGSLPREMWGDSTLTDHDYTQFFWLDGTRVNTSMWANGEPDGRGEDHVMALYKHSFYIFDRPSTRSYGYVCQKNL
ncbi:neurocan core protein-like [Littorina saxatilis]|uniref:neurocan core protein-like n=1 Tax=Littorina saxatilis TaxID=31220 RepID=UPI0038B5B1BB